MHILGFDLSENDQASILLLAERSICPKVSRGARQLCSAIKVKLVLGLASYRATGDMDMLMTAARMIREKREILRNDCQAASKGD